MSAGRTVRAWDLPTRLFHWALVAMILSSWLSYEYSNALGDSTMKWHRYNGYAVLILIVWRLLWGVFGSSTSRFATFVAWPWRAASYGIDLVRGRDRHFLGHNPLGTYMVLVLLAAVTLQTMLGMFATEHNYLTWGPLAPMIADDLTQKITKWHKQFFWYGLIGLIIGALIFAVIGNVLWKKANRLDPASEKDKTRFFIQNQLGMIISIIAFLPLVILIFTNKDLSGKQKGIVGSIAAIALIIAGVTGVDFDPPSIEQYTEQTAQVEALTGGVNHVYWTKSGKSYHLYSDCSYINSDRTTEIFEGTVAQARELKNITDLCDRCERRAVKENEATVPEAIEEAPVETME